MTRKEYEALRNRDIDAGMRGKLNKRVESRGGARIEADTVVDISQKYRGLAIYGEDVMGHRTYITRVSYEDIDLIEGGS